MMVRKRAISAGSLLLWLVVATLVAPAALVVAVRLVRGDGLAFADADPVVLAALITGVFTLIVAILQQSFSEAARQSRRVETIIRAVALQSSCDGKPTPASQQAASLFALETLDELEFALLLLREMLTGEIAVTLETAVATVAVAAATTAAVVEVPEAVLACRGAGALRCRRPRPDGCGLDAALGLHWLV